MQVKTLLILAIIACGAFSTESGRAQPLSSVLAEINVHPYGQSIGALIQMTVAAEEPTGRLNAINELINDLHTQAHEQNEIAQQKIATVRADCTETIGTLQNQLTLAQGNLADARRELDELNDELNEKNRNLQDESANYEQLKADLAKAESDLSIENSEYETKNADYNSLIIACEEGIKLLTRMVHGEEQVKFRNAAVFLELSQMKKNMDKNLKAFSKHSTNPFVEPVIAVLATISEKSTLNYEQLAQCIGLLQDLLNRLRNSLSQLEMRHTQLVNDLNELSGNLSEWIKSSLKIIQIYQERIQEITDRIHQLEQRIDELNDFISTTDSALGNARESCALAEEDYAKAQAKRNHEIATLEKLIEYFNTQVVTTTQTVRAEAYEDRLGL